MNDMENVRLLLQILVLNFIVIFTYFSLYIFVIKCNNVKVGL